MNYFLETDRLRVREFTLQDTDFILELLNTPGWLEFIGDRNVKTEEQARAYLENGPLKSYKENGYGLSLVEKKTDKEAIGMCGIIKRVTLEHPDIGFAFLPAFHGQGYAFEVASKTLEYAKDKLNIFQISAITVPGNERSIRLLTRLGLNFIRAIRPGNENHDLWLYSN